LIPITSEQSLKQPRGGLRLFVSQDKQLLHQASNSEHIIRLGVIETSEQFAQHTLLLDGHGPTEDISFANEQEAANYQWLVELARRAAMVGNWKAMGDKVDAIWNFERTNLKYYDLDMFYAGLRVAGVMGGRFHKHGAFLLADPENHEDIKKVIETHKWKIL